MKLHQRLTVVMALLLVVGLGAADVVTYTSLRSFLYGRLDAQLDSAQHLGVRYLDYSGRSALAATEDGIDDRISPDVYVLVVGHDGRVSLTRPSGSPDRPDPVPALPPPDPGRVELVGSAPSAAGTGTYRPNPDVFVVSGQHGSGALYRAEAVTVPQGTLVVAVSIEPDARHAWSRWCASSWWSP